MTKFEEEFTKNNPDVVSKAKEKLGPEWEVFVNDVMDSLREETLKNIELQNMLREELKNRNIEVNKIETNEVTL